MQFLKNPLKIMLGVSLWFSCVYGETLMKSIKAIREAEAYFEAKEYLQARNIYQALLQGPLESWEKAVVMYNLGCVALAAGDWEEAITIFQSVPLDNQLAPLLKERIQRNLMLTYLKEAMAVNQTGKETAKVVQLLRKAIDQAPKLDQAFCVLQKAEGVSECQPSFEAMGMKAISEYYLAIVLKQYEKQRAGQSPLKEGLSSLLSETDDGLSQQQFMMNYQFNEGLKERYKDLYSQEQKAADPMWAALKQKLQNDKHEGIEERLALLDTAKEKYIEAEAQFAKGHFKESKQPFEEAQSALRALIAKLPPPPPQSGGGAQEKAPPQPQAGATEESQGKSEQAAKDVLEKLLEMEQQDKLPVPTKPIQKKVLRPW